MRQTWIPRCLHQSVIIRNVDLETLAILKAVAKKQNKKNNQIFTPAFYLLDMLLNYALFNSRNNWIFVKLI